MDARGQMSGAVQSGRALTPRGLRSNCVSFTGEGNLQLGQCAGRDERHPADPHSSAKSGFHQYRSRIPARTSFLSPGAKPGGLPLERGNLAQTVIDILALGAAFLLLCASCVALVFSFFVLLFVDL